MNRKTRALLGASALVFAGSFAFAAPASATPEDGFASNPAHDCIQQTTAPVEGGTGANDPANTVYDPYFTGAPSANGGTNNGNAYGQPCAGSVGNADFKDPQGQLPGPQTDGNLNANPNSRWGGNVGYECDENQGIALTNPAHTGCAEIYPGS